MVGLNKTGEGITLKVCMPVEIYCNRKGSVVSEKHREVEFDEDTVRAICVLLVKQYLDNSKALEAAVKKHNRRL